MKNIKAILLPALIFAAFLLFGALASAAVITRADADNLSPGSTGSLRVGVKNDLGKDIEDVSFSLALAGLPITPLGSSEKTISDLEDAESKDFFFTLRAANDAKPGDYNIPYALKYKDSLTPSTGTIGVRITGKTEIVLTTLTENPIVGEKSKINLKIINKGNAEARFASVKVFPSKYTLLSDEQVYIGTINADDFETATFDVVFNSKNIHLSGILEYKDFDNKKIIKDIDESLAIYTKEEAIQKGIISKNNVSTYIIVFIIIIIIWLVVRAIRKRMRKSRSLAPARGG
jgi:uncharacterized membrane protein